MAWDHGEVIVRREVLNDGRPWLAVPVRVVEDSGTQLVTFIATGAALGFVDGQFPTPDGLHPWSGRTAWTGHGTLMVQRPSDHHAVWHFWTGVERRFSCWYVNLQEPFRRTALGYDTQDLELDLVVAPDRTVEVKDLDLMPVRVAEGRYTPSQAADTIVLGERLALDIEAGRSLWDPRWSTWQPDPRWGCEALPDGWADVTSPSKQPDLRVDGVEADPGLGR